MTARTTLDHALVALRAGVQGRHLLKSTPPKQPDDDVARVSRNGLAVIGFATLEEFMRTRLGELMAEASKSPVSFIRLPSALRVAATEGSVAVLAAEIRQARRSGEDSMILIQETGIALASTRGANLNLSPLSLLWTGNNLAAEDVSNALKALQVDTDPWGQMSQLANRMGFALPRLRDVFEEMRSNRHRAAHQASTDTDFLTTRAMPGNILCIAAAFDALASAAVRSLRDADIKYLNGTKVSHQQVTLRFLDDQGAGRYSERSERATRAYRAYTDPELAEIEAAGRAASSQSFLVVRDRQQTPTTWRNGILP